MTEAWRMRPRLLLGCSCRNRNGDYIMLEILKIGWRGAGVLGGVIFGILKDWAKKRWKVFLSPEERRLRRHRSFVEDGILTAELIAWCLFNLGP